MKRWDLRPRGESEKRRTQRGWKSIEERDTVYSGSLRIDGIAAKLERMLKNYGDTEARGIEVCPNVDDKFAFHYVGGTRGRPDDKDKDRVPEARFRSLSLSLSLSLAPVWNVATWKSITLFRSRNIVKRERSSMRENRVIHFSCVIEYFTIHLRGI